MAVIGKIREKSALLLIIIGVAMVAFILGDFLQSGQSFFASGNNNVGEVGDVEISARDFDRKLNEFIAQYEMNNGPANAQVRESIKEQVWNDIVREELLVKQFQILGIDVSPRELDDMITGPNPHPQIKQSFTNPETNVFDPNQVINFLKGLDNMPEERKRQWILFEEGLIQERINTKYNNMITKGMFATSLMIKNTYKEENEKRAIKYVVKRYNTIDDSTITVSDADIKAYYDEHKHEYKQESSRNIEYVKFQVVPSPEDRAAVMEQLKEIAVEFKKAENDSAFVAYNSDLPVNLNYYGQNDFPYNLDSSFFFSEVGSTFGPFEENNTFAVVKISAIKMMPDSVKARHILISATQPGDSTGYKKLDSLKTVIKAGGNFAELAKEHSDDVGSAVEGGDLGWFTQGTMVGPFNDACFNGNKGDLVIVQTQFGFHLIEIQDQAEKVKKVRLAKVALNITPSSETYDNVFAQVSQFYSANSSSSEFTATYEKEEENYQKGLATSIKPGDKTITGIGSARELVRWAFKNEQGAISEPLQFDNTYVIAHLSEVLEDGIAPLDQIKEELKVAVIQKKKGEQLSKEMEGSTDLKQLAETIGVPLSTNSAVNFATYSIPGIGQEPKVIGVTAALNKGEMTKKPVVGSVGVYMIEVEDVTPAPESADYTNIKQQLNSRYASVASGTLEALKDKFGVKDMRYKFY